jgi:hypothetical protein
MDMGQQEQAADNAAQGILALGSLGETGGLFGGGKQRPRVNAEVVGEEAPQAESGKAAKGETENDGSNETRPVTGKGVTAAGKAGFDYTVSNKVPFDEWQMQFAGKLPIKNAKRLTPFEQYTAEALQENDPTVELKEYGINNDYDYYTGKSEYKADKVYDQMGSPGASMFWNSTADKFFDAIDRHVLKGNSITVIDLRFFTPEQITEIETYVYSHVEDPQAKICFIRFPS